MHAEPVQFAVKVEGKTQDARPVKTDDHEGSAYYHHLPSPITNDPIVIATSTERKPNLNSDIEELLAAKDAQIAALKQEVASYRSGRAPPVVHTTVQEESSTFNLERKVSNGYGQCLLLWMAM